MRKITDNGDGTLRLESKCLLCQKPSYVERMPADGWALWDEGKGPFIQVALPTLTPAERETILSGCHDACFDTMFPPDEED